jgi:hypothetical protein
VIPLGKIFQHVGGMRTMRFHINPGLAHAYHLPTTGSTRTMVEPQPNRG